MHQVNRAGSGSFAMLYRQSDGAVEYLFPIDGGVNQCPPVQKDFQKSFSGRAFTFRAAAFNRRGRTPLVEFALNDSVSNFKGMQGKKKDRRLSESPESSDCLRRCRFSEN